MSGAAETVGDWLATLVSWVLLRPWSVVIIGVSTGALGVLFAMSHLGVNTDTANMISSSLPWRKDFNDFRASFPVRDQNLVVVIDAPTSAAADEFAGEFIGELRKMPGSYRAVLMNGEGEFFERNGLLYLNVDELSALVDRLAAAQPLIGLLERRFDGAAVLDVAGRTIRAASTDDTQNAAAFYAAIERVMTSLREGQIAPLRWQELLAGRPDTTRRIVVLQPTLDFTRLQPASEAIRGLRSIAQRLNADRAQPVRVRLTGSVAMEHEELESVSRGAEWGALATVLMVAAVLYAALRSWRLLLISLLTLLVGLSMTAAFAALAVGHLNLLSVAFVVLNVGLGSDYVIHVLLRYKELTGRGADTRTALLETMRGVGSSLVLCAITTAAGFYSFIPTTFSGVSELGLIAGTGVFFGLFVSVTLLPALIAVVGRSKSVLTPPWISAHFFAPLNRRPRFVLGATAVVLVATAALLPRVSFDSNPIHLRDARSESVSTLLELEDDGEAQMLNVVAIAKDSETARAWATELRQHAEVRRVVTVDQLVPSEQDTKVAMLEDLQLILGPGFGELVPGPASPSQLEQSLAALEVDSEGVAAASDLHAAVAATRSWLAQLSMRARADALVSLDAALTSSLPSELGRLKQGLTAKPFTREDLPSELSERWLASDGRELVEITSVEDVSNNAAAARFISAVKEVAPHATGLPVVYQEASATVVAAFERAFLYALVMVSIIIWLVLRRVKDTLLVLAPIALAAVVTAGLTVAIGVPFNYANVIALPLLVGIGVDNGIHVVHRMHTETTAELFDSSTLKAVLASGLTTVASFGNLAFSAHAGTASMGILLALGLGVSMAATLIVLPAWLALSTSGRRLA